MGKYTSCYYSPFAAFDEEAIERFKEAGIRPPNTAKAGAIKKGLSKTDKDILICAIKNGYSIRAAITNTKINYSQFRNSYYDKNNTEFHDNVQNAKKFSYNRLDKVLYDKAVGIGPDGEKVDPDFDAAVVCARRLDSGYRVHSQLVASLKESDTKYKIAKLAYANRSSDLSAIMQMIPLITEACLEIVGPDQSSKITELIINKLTHAMAVKSGEQGQLGSSENPVDVTEMDNEATGSDEPETNGEANGNGQSH